MKKIAVIGGGASGLMAAIAAGMKARGNCGIIIWEKNDRVGKKILQTGNGRCNLSNLNLSIRYYHGQDICLAKQVLSRYGVEETRSFFHEIGLLTKADSEGRIYPYSEQASAVLDVLRLKAKNLGIEMRTGFEVKDISVQQGGKEFSVSDGTDFVTADRVIFAAGSPAGGSGEEMFKLPIVLGHTITAVYPALVQLKTGTGLPNSLKGVGFYGRISLIDEATGDVVASDTGNLLFTEYGISGIPAMQVSGYLNGRRLIAEIDFMPDYGLEWLTGELKSRRDGFGEWLMEDFFTGLIHKRIGMALCKHAGLEKLNVTAADVPESFFGSIAGSIKGLRLPVTGTNGFKNAQTTAGGIRLNEFEPLTMESKRVKGFYACGEILDIYGDCGGYNLQWAWTSGRIAGESAAE